MENSIVNLDEFDEFDEFIEYLRMVVNENEFITPDDDEIDLDELFENTQN